MSTEGEGGARIRTENRVVRPGGMGNSYSETKPFWLTSEFLVFAAAVAGILIASAIDDNIDAPLAWRLVSYVAIGYMISRGLAKAGSRDPDRDPRRGDR